MTLLLALALLAPESFVICVTAQYEDAQGICRESTPACKTLYVQRTGYMAGRYTEAVPRPRIRRVWCWIGGTVAGVDAQSAGVDTVILDGATHSVREDGFVR